VDFVFLINRGYSADFDVIIDEEDEDLLSIDIDGSCELARRFDFDIVRCG
jgi:hypothetical protein